MKKQDQTIDRDQSKSKGVKVMLHENIQRMFEMDAVKLIQQFQLCLGDDPNEGKGEAGEKSKNDAQVKENLAAVTSYQMLLNFSSSV